MKYDGCLHTDQTRRAYAAPGTPVAPLGEAQIEALRRDVEQQGWVPGLSALLKVGDNPTRLRILYLLWRHGELRGTDLATLLGMTTPAISQQVKRLRRRQLVTARERGKSLYFGLNARSVFLEGYLLRVFEALSLWPYDDHEPLC